MNNSASTTAINQTQEENFFKLLNGDFALNCGWKIRLGFSTAAIENGLHLYSNITLDIKILWNLHD